MTSIRWREAMSAALYGPEGFFVAGAGPAAHFRTSVHAAPAFTGAVLRLLDRIDHALDRPDPLHVVDVGAGRGELLTALAGLAPAGLRERLRLTAVELAPRPPDLPAAIGWQDRLPAPVTGLLVATEWLDNVPLDVADRGAAAPPRYALVDPATGDESPGTRLDPDDADWLARWWPGDGRAEIGLPRDLAWRTAVDALDRGLALAVDYGHLLADRPPAGTLTGFRHGRQVLPLPDGSCDITAHVAVDSVAAAGSAAAGLPYQLLTQRAALRALGVDGARPPLALAATDPAGYVRSLAAASAAAELLEPAGLGGHWWLLQPVGVAPILLD
ncbi:SAM-dependent methyltransferase [Polymorphospora rubra]|uniref:SAM-dependent methyltransferase n=1 Tax=Polymorphospora rubra TaxID=338584 RepID=UPI0034001916